MPIEIDAPPQPNTFKAFVREAVAGLQYLRAYWGRRLIGGAIGIPMDAIAEAVTQAFYARLPGHPQQAPDSLRQSGFDRVLNRFRGETDANWVARVRAAWDDYAQAGTKPQMLRVLNQWGRAGWPGYWVDLGDPQWVESAHTSFTFSITIPYGNITPAWNPWLVGDPGIIIGDPDLFVGIGPSNDIPMLLYLVRKWKRAASKGFVTVYYNATQFVTFVVGQGGY